MTAVLAALCLLLPAPYAGVAILSPAFTWAAVWPTSMLLLAARAGKDARFLDGGTVLLIAGRR